MPVTAASLSLRRKLLWVGLFALSMGYFEAALVEDLRQLYYPEGFTFPLSDIPLRMLLIELGREAASLLMLASVAVLMGSSFIDRFAGFAYGFGVWDITYYLFLELFEGWPSSPGTTDLLFLTPAPWVGPVWAPLLVSAALIWAASCIWHRFDRGLLMRPTRLEWILEIAAGCLIIASFLAGAPTVMRKEMPPAFPWYIWLTGMALGIGIFLRALHHTEKTESS